MGLHAAELTFSDKGPSLVCALWKTRTKPRREYHASIEILGILNINARETRASLKDEAIVTPYF